MRKSPKDIDFEKAKLEITWSDNNVGILIKYGEEALDWNNLTYTEQVKVLNSLRSTYELFYRFLKKEE